MESDSSATSSPCSFPYIERVITAFMQADPHQKIEIATYAAIAAALFPRAHDDSLINLTNAAADLIVNQIAPFIQTITFPWS